MKNLFLAKSNPKETIIEHTENLLKEYNRIKKIYPNLENVNWNLLYLACLYHDLGKMNTKFQNKIINNINKFSKEQIEKLLDKNEEIEEIPHGYLSCAFIPIDYLKDNFTEDEIKILYESIFYHHNREKLEGKRKQELLSIVNKDLSRYIDEFVYDKLINNKSLNTRYMRYIKTRVLEKYLLVNYDGSINEEDSIIARKFIMTKGLLNKIDFAASSGVQVEIESGQLQEYTEKSIEKFGLNKLQLFMKENQNRSLIVRASTGIGKTEGALIWIGNNKGFFTLPLKVSINAIYDRIIGKIGYSKEKTALLHSDSASEYMKRDEEGVINKAHLSSTKQLSFPLTICTLDQLIGFIFKYEGFELKLATLSYSKLVIDEIQMYSPDLVAYLILALRDIVVMGGQFAILTATFPPVFEYFMNFVGINENINYIKPTEPFLKEIDGEIMLRHKIKVYQKNIKHDEIVKKAKGKKILVIVNTVKLAQRLYKEINDLGRYNVHTFHSKFTKEDRANKENSIFYDGQLENSFEGIWITTQVVEASLDIDFDILYTELSDISGLLQRMGRVYRNRKLNSEEPNVHIFVGNEKRPSGINGNKSIIDIDVFEKSREAIIEYDNCELNEYEKMKMVDKVYSVENLSKSAYFRKIQDTIMAFNDIEPYNLKKNEARLRDISSVTVMPKSIYENNKYEINQLIEQLEKEEEFSKKLVLRNLILDKTIDVQEYEVDNIRKKGANIKVIEISKFEQIYVIPAEYSFEVGLEPAKEIEIFDEEQFL